MHKVRNIFSLICCLMIAILMLGVGVLSSTIVNLGVVLEDIAVNYDPQVSAMVYLATSNPTNADNNNYYYSGSGEFPATSYLVADNVTSTADADPAIANATSDAFGYYTIYVNVLNYSLIDVAVDISLTKSDDTVSENISILENEGILSISARDDDVVSSDIAVIKVKVLQVVTESLKLTINLTKAI